MESCKNPGIGEHGYCIEHGCCLCGGVMLADTEDWKVHLCFECLQLIVDNDTEGEFARARVRVGQVVEMAYEAGRRSVIGYCEPDAVVEGTK
jgi:hypothetical protein